MGFLSKAIGLILLLMGIVAMLSFPDWNNPISFISDPLFNLTKMFLTPFSSLIFWLFVTLLGLTLMEPKEGYLKKLAHK